MLGTLLATPALLVVEGLFPAEREQEWLDLFGQQGWWQALLAEYLQVLPAAAGLVPSESAVTFNKPILHPQALAAELADEAFDAEAEHAQVLRQRREHLYDKLPEVIGRDIVAHLIRPALLECAYGVGQISTIGQP